MIFNDIESNKVKYEILETDQKINSKSDCVRIFEVYSWTFQDFETFLKKL